MVNFRKGMDSSVILVSLRYNIFSLELVFIFVYSIFILMKKEKWIK